MRSTDYICRAAAVAVLSALGGVASGCGEVARSGRSPAFLIIDRLEGASGAEPEEFGTVVQSDVETVVETTVGEETLPIPTIFNDIGRVTFRSAFKNPELAPTPLSDITITRYRVAYRRSDGRSTQGVDVPYSFDGAFTVTVPTGGSASAAFDLVRTQAKREPPLSNMVRGGAASIISAIAEVSFFGRDQAGNEVMAVGMIGVNFADFGDPQ